MSVPKKQKSTVEVLDDLIAAHRGSKNQSRERSLLITKLQEAQMWASVDVVAADDPVPGQTQGSDAPEDQGGK